MSLLLERTYLTLPPDLFAKILPTPVAAPRRLVFNADLARALDLDAAYLAGPEGLEVLSGNRLLPQSEPVALGYAGHQFGKFSPTLGDGRAILVGEAVDTEGKRWDLQLKGSGRTPFTRWGDGRATLASVLREYLVSEAMAALGIPTTRALAAVATGETVLRETPEPGGVLTRVAASHIRIGTFQFLAARGKTQELRRLADHVMDRHYPDAALEPHPYRALLRRIVVAHAGLVAHWAGVGFVHGVMNTDNMSIAGETIDYGPCAFLDDYEPGAVFSSIDVEGRYAFDKQARMAAWNLARLAEAMLPLLAENEDDALNVAQEAIDAFMPAFEAARLEIMGAKIGLKTVRPSDAALIDDLLTLMALRQADFTLTFRGLAGALLDGAPLHEDMGPDFTLWRDRWRQRAAEDGLDPEARRRIMLRCNPAIIPRNHHVAAVLRAATEDEDIAPFLDFLKRLSEPFADSPQDADRYGPPLPHERIAQTFCGT